MAGDIVGHVDSDWVIVDAPHDFIAGKSPLESVLFLATALDPP